MSLSTIIRETWIKVVVGVASAALLGGAYWLQSNIVFAGDLEAVADMIAAQVAAEIAPLARQATANSQDICTGKKTALKAAIRDLRVEIHEMETAKASGEPWGTRDEALLVEWRSDLEEAEGQLDSLDC